MEWIDELPRAPMALGALWLLALAWWLNNPTSGAPAARPGAGAVRPGAEPARPRAGARLSPAGPARPTVDLTGPDASADDCCPFCGVACDAEGPVCWCALAEAWR